MNITNKILLALKLELKQKYSASKSQHCQINKKRDENDVLFKKVTQAYSEKRNPSAPIRFDY